MPSTKPNSPLAEFHGFAGHLGPAAGCESCAKRIHRQRRTAIALRSQRRQASQQIDFILRKAAR
jgi:hypothetical protein